MNQLTLIVGGARSGKSRFAPELGAKLGREGVYIVTARALDTEMALRIEEPERLCNALRLLLRWENAMAVLSVRGLSRGSRPVGYKLQKSGRERRGQCGLPRCTPVLATVGRPV